MLRQDTMTPLYVQLMNHVEASIQNGEYKPGDKIPTENEMAKAFGVSVITVRRAIAELSERGLVVKKQGKGTFVTREKYARNMKKLQSFSEMCEQMGVTPGAKMLANRLVPADEAVAKRLGVPVGSNVVYILRLRYADHDPVQIEKSYFPLKYAFLLEARFDDNSLFDYLREHADAQVVSSEKTIELCRVNVEEAELLGVHKGDAQMLVSSTAYDKNGDPMYAGVQIINGTRFSLYVYETIGENA